MSAWERVEPGTRVGACVAVENSEDAGGVLRVHRSSATLAKFKAANPHAASRSELRRAGLMPAEGQQPCAFVFNFDRYVEMFDRRRAVPFEPSEEERARRRELDRQRREKRAEESGKIALELEKREAEERALAARVRAATGCPEEAATEQARWPHTSWQWLTLGFVPKTDAKWGCFGPAPDYFYCWFDSTVWNPEEARRLLESGPVEVDALPSGAPYDGRPWWQDKCSHFVNL